MKNSKIRQVQVKTKRNVITHAYLKMASYNALEQAKQTETGSFYNLMTSMLCCAFAMEAFLNHIGEQQINRWDILKKKLSPNEKLEVITSTIGYKIEKGKRPFQTFQEIFKFRNTLVHAESEYLEEESEQKLIMEEVPKQPKTNWEKQVNLETAQKIP
ncbi:conserved hypothetical protein [Beggiatoa sp. PS]|nr:conserved hypothetical protein [Beggiatoa sp. PS]